MTLEEVMQFIKDNEKDEKVQAYVKGFVTLDRVQAFLETDEGKQLMQPRLDNYFRQRPRDLEDEQPPEACR